MNADVSEGTAMQRVVSKGVVMKKVVPRGSTMKIDVFDVLSDDALWERVEELTRKERRITFNVVLHLGEVERRRIYLHRGFGSMFDYCTRWLGYSESAAYRRIATCRCIRKFPEVAELLRRGTLTITTVAMVSGVISRDNLCALLRAVSGKSQNDVKKIVAGYKTGKPFRDRIKPIVIERPAIPLAMDRSIDTETLPGVCGHAADAMVANSPERAVDSMSENPGTNATKVGENHLRYEGENDPIHPRATHPQPPARTRHETYYEFTITADEEFMYMLSSSPITAVDQGRPGAGYLCDIQSTDARTHCPPRA